MSSNIEPEPNPKAKSRLKVNIDAIFFAKKGKECIPIPFINDILYITHPNTRKFRTLSSVVNYIRKSEYPVLVVHQRDEKYPMYVGVPYEHLQAIKYGASILQILINVPKFGQHNYLKLILNREVQPMTYWDIFPPTDWTGLHSINHPGFRYVISQLVAEYISEDGVGIHNTFINDILESDNQIVLFLLGGIKMDCNEISMLKKTKKWEEYIAKLCNDHNVSVEDKSIELFRNLYFVLKQKNGNRACYERNLLVLSSAIVFYYARERGYNVSYRDFTAKDSLKRFNRYLYLICLNIDKCLSIDKSERKNKTIIQNPLDHIEDYIDSTLQTYAHTYRVCIPENIPVFSKILIPKLSTHIANKHTLAAMCIGLAVLHFRKKKLIPLYKIAKILRISQSCIFTWVGKIARHYGIDNPADSPKNSRRNLEIVADKIIEKFNIVPKN